MKLSIKSFMEEHEHSYPYSTVFCACQGHYPKWLLATSKNKMGLVLRKFGYCVIKTCCLSHDNIQNLIISVMEFPYQLSLLKLLMVLKHGKAFTGRVGWKSHSNLRMDT